MALLPDWLKRQFLTFEKLDSAQYGKQSLNQTKTTKKRVAPQKKSTKKSRQGSEYADN